MRVDTTGYPPSLYENESITIECTATEYTDLVNLQIRGRDEPDNYHGCLLFRDRPSFQVGLLQNSFPRLTREICESTLHRTTPPSTLSVTGTVTKDLAGLQLYCYAGETSREAEDGNLAIGVVMSKWFRT